MLQKLHYAFIDSQNLNLAIRDQGWTLDFARFRQFLTDKFSVEKAFLFIGYVGGNERLYTSMQRAGYIIIFKPTLQFHRKDDTIIKGNVDAELVLHAMIELPNYEKAIIVSGDGDFHCLIEYLEKENKLLRLMIPHPKKFSALLRRFRPYFSFISDFRHRLKKGE